MQGMRGHCVGGLPSFYQIGKILTLAELIVKAGFCVFICAAFRWDTHHPYLLFRFHLGRDRCASGSEALFRPTPQTISR